MLSLVVLQAAAAAGLAKLGIGIGSGIAAVGAGIGIGIATGRASEAVARQPEAESKISKSLLLGCALAEATAIYGFVIGLLAIILLK